MVNAQEWLDRNYPQAQRNNVREISQPLIINLGGNEIIKVLEGDLIIEGFPNLSEICLFENRLNLVKISNCPECHTVQFHDNQVVSIEFVDCPKIRYFDCSNNKLSQLPTGLNPETLVHLDISDNNLTGDLSILSRFINLTCLEIRKNKLSGSLRSLASLERLNELNVSVTWINSGLEYLSYSLQRIYCHPSQFPQLKHYRVNDEGNGEHYDYQAWRGNNEELIEQAEEQLLQAQIEVPLPNN